MSFDVNKFVGDVAKETKNHFDLKLADISERLARLEARQPEKGADGIGVKDGGIDRDGVFFLVLSDGTKKDFGKVVGKDGDSAPEIDLQELAKSAAKLVEVPEPVAVDLEALAKSAAELIDKPKDGKDADSVDLEALAKAAAELVEVPEIDAGELAKKAASLVEVPDPIPGKDAEPVDTLALAKQVAEIVPAGKDGNDAEPVDIEDIVKQVVAQMPAPQDGVGFDDMKVEFDGKRTFKFVFERDDVRKEFVFKAPIPIHQGTHKGAGDTRSFEKGDIVTYGGAMWHCVNDTSSSPSNSDDWILAVKKGKDGKDGARGLPGARGRDMTAAR